MTREEIIKEIKETEKKLNDLKNKLDNTPTTSLKEQFQNVLIKGDSSNWLIKRTPDGFINNYIKNWSKHETVYIEELVDDIFYDYLVDNYKDCLEILDILGVDEDDILNEDEYNKRLENNFETKPKQYFLDFINDVIEGGVSEFKIDW